MAKIVLITDHLSPTVRQVSQSLSDLKNEVLVICERQAEALDGVETWSYFKTFSILETAKLLPRLVWLHPDTVHFFIHETPAKSTFLMLQRIFSTMPHCVVSTSFLTSKVFQTHLGFVQKSLLFSDIVTLPDLTTMRLLKGQELRPKQLRSLLPPLLEFRKVKKPKSPVSLLSEIQTNDTNEKKSFLMLFTEELLLRPAWESLLPLAKHSNLLIWLDRSQYSIWNKKSLEDLLVELKIQKSVQVLGLGFDEMQNLWPSLSGEFEGFILSHAQLDAEELGKFVNLSFENDLPLVLNETQASQYSNLFENGKNAWVVRSQHGTHPLLETLKSVSTLESKESKTSLSSIQNKMLDSVINELNRIYGRAHRLKSMG